MKLLDAFFALTEKSEQRVLVCFYVDEGGVLRELVAAEITEKIFALANTTTVYAEVDGAAQVVAGDKELREALWSHDQEIVEWRALQASASRALSYGEWAAQRLQEKAARARREMTE